MLSQKQTAHLSSETADETQTKLQHKLYYLCSPFIACFCRGNLDTTCPVSLPNNARVAKFMNNPVSTTPEELSQSLITSLCMGHFSLLVVA